MKKARYIPPTKTMSLATRTILAIACFLGSQGRHNPLADASASGASTSAASRDPSPSAWGDRRRRPGVVTSLPEVLPAVRPQEDEGLPNRELDVVNVAPNVSDESGRTVSVSDSELVVNSGEAIGSDQEKDWRRTLPPLLRRRGTLHRVVIPPHAADDEGCEVYLLGTSHVSRDSCDDAQLLVEHVLPHCLFVELCHQRLALLSDDAASPPSSGDGSKNSGGDGITTQAKLLQEHNPGMTRTSALSAVLLTKIQGDYATKLGVTIGGEFRASYKVARAQQKAYEAKLWRRRYEAHVFPQSPQRSMSEDAHGCVVVLGDRPVRLTLVRAWESLSVLGKVRLILGLIWSSIRQPSEKELREWMDSIMKDPGNDLLSKSIEELGKHFPTIGEVIIHERDRYMTAKLVQTARLLENIPASSGRNRRRIVAVVGAGHCPGMLRLLKESDREMCTNPEKVLRSLVETKHSTVESNFEVSSLTTDVTELNFQ